MIFFCLDGKWEKRLLKTAAPCKPQNHLFLVIYICAAVVIMNLYSIELTNKDLRYLVA